MQCCGKEFIAWFAFLSCLQLSGIPGNVTFDAIQKKKNNKKKQANKKKEWCSGGSFVIKNLMKKIAKSKTFLDVDYLC